MTVGEALTAYRSERGIDPAGDHAETFVVPIGPLRRTFPNPGKIPLHDLHHLCNGYDTSLIGEAEVSCFELRGGGVTPLIAFLCAGAIVLGLALGPRRVLAAWRRARGDRKSVV